MQTDLCVLISTGTVLAGLVLAAGLLLWLLTAAISSSSSSSDIEATRGEIRRIGTQARGEIRETAESYQREAERILSKKR